MNSTLVLVVAVFSASYAGSLLGIYCGLTIGVRMVKEAFKVDGQ